MACKESRVRHTNKTIEVVSNDKTHRFNREQIPYCLEHCPWLVLITPNRLNCPSRQPTGTVPLVQLVLPL